MTVAKGREFLSIPGPTNVPDAVLAASVFHFGELRVRVLAHLQTLPEAYRDTLVWRLVEGLSGPEISRLTGRTPGSVRVNLCRGMALLRERLSEEGWR